MVQNKNLRRVKSTEADIKKTIMDFLDFSHLLYIRPQPLSPHARKDKDGKWVYGWHKVRDSQRGQPDLIVFMPRKVALAVETKSFDGRLQEDQQKWHDKWIKAGQDYVLVKSFEEFRKVIDARL